MGYLITLNMFEIIKKLSPKSLWQTYMKWTVMVQKAFLLPNLNTCFRLTLRMLGNFLKIDYIVVCFSKALNSAYFLWEMTDWVANRLISGQPPSYSAAGLDPTCLHKHKCGSRTERVNSISTYKTIESINVSISGLSRELFP